MPVSRREFIAGVGALTGMRFLAPIVTRAGAALGATLPDPATSARNRLVVIFLQGGNDGLNTVIPRGDASGTQRYSVYRQVRPSLRYDPSQTLPLELTPTDTSQMLGLNPKLPTLHSLYGQQRVAIVQGVDYPGHSYSHFVSTDIWQSGQPGQAPDSGWLGRHLDRSGISDGELRGLGIGYELPLILRGDQALGVEVASIAETRFADGSAAAGDARHAALARYADHPEVEPLRHFVGQQAAETVALVGALEGVPAPPRTANSLANALMTARVMLEQDFGVECVFVYVGGYDTHTNQTLNHERLLADLDAGIEAFLFGTMGGVPQGIGPIPPALADRTLLMTTSEFGRRIGENGSGTVAGTDHGAAGPLFLIGPPSASTAAGALLVPGLHGDHPPMGTTLAPADNLTSTTELRGVYQATLQSWLGDPDPGFEAGGYAPLPGLFANP